MLCSKEDNYVNCAAEALRNFPQRKVCQLFGISRSTLYYRRSHPQKDFATPQEKKAVIEMFRSHFGWFGRRTLHYELKKKNIHISQYRISKILKEAGLRSKYGRKKCHNVHTHKNTVVKYISDNIFPELTAADKLKEIWSIDFTEQKVDGQTVISCGIVSVNGKYVVSLIPGVKNNKEVACQAIREGIEKFGIPYMVMSDRGSPFVSKSFNDELASRGILHSMSRAHTPTDNRFIETFWKSMKTEIGKVNHLSQDVYTSILHYYEHYYNFLRPHSVLGYNTPIENLNNDVI